MTKPRKRRPLDGKPATAPKGIRSPSPMIVRPAASISFILPIGRGEAVFSSIKIEDCGRSGYVIRLSNAAGHELTASIDKMHLRRLLGWRALFLG
jgi:hypothetical protein